MKSLLAAFFAEVALITYRAFSQSGVTGGGISTPAQAPINLPLPAYYTAPIIFYSALALIPDSGAQFAAALGWGMVVATGLNLWNPVNIAAVEKNAQQLQQTFAKGPVTVPAGETSALQQALSANQP